MKKFHILWFAVFLVSGAMGQTDQPCSSCLPQGITFSTQSQIDNFQTNYPGCTEIEGNVTIQGSDITNLNGLNVLTSIGGTLIIIDNDDLTSLTGLENLNSIYGGLIIQYNDALTNLSGLENMTSNGGLYISSNNAMIDLSGLENLTSLEGTVEITDNDALTSLSGLENLASIGGFLKIGNVWDYGNPNLTSLIGLDNLTSVGQGLWIWGNDELTSLTGLNNLTSIGGDLIIDSNPITSLSDLGNLTSIGGSFSIRFTIALINLSGLDNLTSIGGALNIWGNNALTSLAGLDSINAGSITDLTISGNGNLSTCAVRSICDYIAAPNGYTGIYDNATGCNSKEEVDSACVYISNAEITLGPSFVIYPNPASTTITIAPPAKGSLSIHNTSGQSILQQIITQPTTTIDVSGWKSGVYVVKVVGEKGVCVGKFIKQ